MVYNLHGPWFITFMGPLFEVFTKDLRFDETVREHEPGGNTKRKTTGANLVWMIWRLIQD